MKNGKRLYIHPVHRQEAIKKLPPCDLKSVLLRDERKCPNIDLSGVDLSSKDDFLLLMSALRDSHHIRELNLSRCSIGSDGAHALGHVLNFNGSMHVMGKPVTFKELRKLDIEEEDTDLHGALTKLDLRDVAMSAEGVRALSEGLKSNVLITSLNGVTLDYKPWLSFASRLDGVRPYELVWMSQRLHYLDIEEEDSCNSLTALDLSCCKLSGGFPFEDYDGVQALADALSANHSITHLDVRKSDLFTQGAEIIAEGLRTNTALTSLDMSDNDIAVEGAQHFLDFVVRHNSVLYLLDLTLNNVRQNAKDRIKDAGLQHNVIIKVTSD